METEPEVQRVGVDNTGQPLLDTDRVPLVEVADMGQLLTGTNRAPVLELVPESAAGTDTVLE